MKVIAIYVGLFLCVALVSDSEDAAFQPEEVQAVPLSDLIVTIKKDEKDGTWYILLKSMKWRLVGNSYSKRGGGVLKLKYGEFTGVPDASGSASRRILEVESGVRANLYLEDFSGKLLLFKKFDGVSWIDP